jgi:hypothetical protein
VLKPGFERAPSFYPAGQSAIGFPAAARFFFTGYKRAFWRQEFHCENPPGEYLVPRREREIGMLYVIKNGQLSIFS